MKTEIKKMEWNDLEDIRIFQPEGWSDIVELFRYNLSTPFCSSLKLVRDHQIIAVGNIVFYGDSAWLSQIIVHPAHRNKGFGKEITKALLDHIDNAQYPSVVLDATFLGFPVYKSVGFELVSEYAHFDAPTQKNKFAKKSAAMPFEKKWLEKILALDRVVTGEDRKLKLIEAVADSILVTNGDELAAVYFPTLAKGPIIAGDPIAGVELMERRMETATSAMMPAENKTAIDFLLRSGWTHSRNSRRMIFGKKPDWKPENIFNVVSGAFG